MATTAPYPQSRSATGKPWVGPGIPPGNAQGEEAKSLLQIFAAENRREHSVYFQHLISGRSGTGRPNRLPIVAPLLILLGVFLFIAGCISEWQGILLIAAFVSLLGGYAGLARWLSRIKNPSGIVRFAERIRQILAYEGDPRSR